MAGGDNHHGPLMVDPALTKFNNLGVQRYKYFRWTPRTAWLTIAYVIIVPGMFGYLGWSSEGKYNMRGKWRGDPIREF